MNYYIIGFMGSGKSTFGKELSEALGYSFIDTDTMIIEKEGRGIPDIFEEEGEEEFRNIESEVLRSTAKLENTVIATGGGAPCYKDNLAWMKAHGQLVYLKLFEGELEKRLKADKEERPMLKDVSEEDLPGYIYETLRQRAAYYHQADFVIDPLNMDARTLAEVLKEQQA